jgi:hypothetical protein
MVGKYSIKSDLNTIKSDYVKGRRFQSNLKSITVKAWKVAKASAATGSKFRILVRLLAEIT